MDRYLDDLRRTIKHYGSPPVFYVGDVFHTWKEPAELVNFLIKRLPVGFAIPGQHDLPFHRYKDKTKSPYWTLVESSVLADMEPNVLYKVNADVFVVGFPWEHRLQDFPKRVAEAHPDVLKVLIAHKYVWTAGCEYKGASRENHVESLAQHGVFQTYDAAFFGDNHKGFLAYERTVMNCGAFYNAKSDEKTYMPQVGVLLRSGKIMRHYLDRSKDEWLDSSPSSSLLVGDEDLTESFLNLVEKSFDFRIAVSDFIASSTLSPTIKDYVYRALEVGHAESR